MRASSVISFETLKRLQDAGLLFCHHSSWSRGYVSRKGSPCVEFYRGRFGIGFRVFSSSIDSSRYCRVTYYVYDYSNLLG